MTRKAFIGFMFLMAWIPKTYAELPMVAERQGVPVITAVKVNPAPVIDGVLDDAVWKEVPSVSDFWCIDLNKEPADLTVMQLAYDEQNLYFAFYCKDSQPDKIVAVETKRNGSFRRDDHVILHLDPTHLHRDDDDSFNFMVTARGTQGEEIPGGAAYKTEWRGDWQAAALKVDDGYIIEMAIPLAILRYPAGQSSFGIWADRRHARTLERSTYPKMSGDFNRTKTADWIGLQLPAVRRPLRFMPYSMIDMSHDGKKPRLGFDLKKTFSSGLTTISSAMPDFRNIEGEILSLDFSYNERLAKETRPFFVDGQGFMPPRTLFASQRVKDMDLGFKAFGNVGATQLGFIGVYDGYKHRAVAFKLNNKLSEYLQVSGAFSDRFDNDSNSDNAIDMNYKDNKNNRAWQASANYSHPTVSGTPYVHTDFSSLLSFGEDIYSYNIELGFSPANRRLGGSLDYGYVGKNYKPADGFIPERDLVRIGCALEYEIKMPVGSIEEWKFDTELRVARHTDGAFFYDRTKVDTSLGFRNGTGIALSPIFGRWREGDTLFKDRVLELEYLWNRFKQYRQGRLKMAFGKQAKSSLLQVGLQQGFLFRQNFSLNLSAEYRRGFDKDEGRQLADRQTILSINYDFTSERGVVGRLVERDRSLNWYLAYRQNVRRGMDAFVIVGDPNAKRFEPRLALKTVLVY